MQISDADILKALTNYCTMKGIDPDKAEQKLAAARTAVENAADARSGYQALAEWSKTNLR